MVNRSEISITNGNGKLGQERKQYLFTLLLKGRVPQINFIQTIGHNASEFQYCLFVQPVSEHFFNRA